MQSKEESIISFGLQTARGVEGERTKIPSRSNFFFLKKIRISERKKNKSLSAREGIKKKCFDHITIRYEVSKAN